MQGGLAGYQTCIVRIFKLRNTEVSGGLTLGCVRSVFQPLLPCRTLMKLIYLHRANVQIKALTSTKTKSQKSVHILIESDLVAVGKNSVVIFRLMLVFRRFYKN